MRLVAVAKGRRHRVQIQVIDQTGEATPEHLRKARPRFEVRVLPATANQHSTFASAGKRVYWGDEPDYAWNAAAYYVEGLSSKVPRDLQELMMRWSRGSRPEGVVGELASVGGDGGDVPIGGC